MSDRPPSARLTIVLYTYGLAFTGNTLEQQSLGGAETAFIYVARELARAGHSVIAFCLCSQEGRFDGVEYRDHTKLAEWRRDHSCDLFICSRYFHVFAEPLRARVKVLWNHDPLDDATLQQLRGFLPAIDYLVCLSDYHVQLFANGLAGSGAIILKSSNGVDLDLTERARVGATKQHKIMYSSRPERGLWRALDIYERLGDKNLELLACTYQYSDRADIRAIEERCAERIGALNRAGFRIRTGSFAKHALYQHMAESKAVIYPTYTSEIFCISAIEAQACGTLFMSTKDFGMRETIAYHGFNPDDIDGFAAELQRMLANADARQQLEQIGLEHARRYSWQAVAQRFVDDALRYLEQRQSAAQAALQPQPTTQPSPAYLAVAAAPALAIAQAARLQQIHALWRAGAQQAEQQQQAARAIIAAEQPRDLPLISCLTVTLNRIVQLKDAIRCYCRQSYPHRELVIVSDGNARYQQAITDHIQALGRSDIRTIFLDNAGYTLGQVRNIALEAAAGQLICQWDDDDLCHPDRLWAQYSQLARDHADACCMTDQLHFFAQERELYWVDWRRGGRAAGVWDLIPGTLMMVKDARFRYPEAGPNARAGEDTILLTQLSQQVKIARLKDAGHLYVYTYHGTNTWSRDHHRELNTIAIAPDESKQAVLRLSLPYYALPMPYAFKDRSGQTLFVHNT